MATRRGISVLSNAFKSATSYAYRTGVSQHRMLPPLCQRQLHSSSIRLTVNSPTVINIQDENDFEKRVLQSTKPVIVDFHATWCKPCKMLAPRLEKAVSKIAESISLVKIDVDKFEDLALKYKVQGVPAVFAVKDGKVVNKFVGLQDEDIIEEFVEQLTK